MIHSEVINIKNESNSLSNVKIERLLNKVSLFENLTKEEIHELLMSDDIDVQTFAPHKKIYTPDGFEKKVGIIIKGECLVSRIKQDGMPIPLNSLKQFDFFGVLAVFSEREKFPTLITSKAESTVLFLSENILRALCIEYPKLALSLIEFMCKKIDFLNKKIATFTSDSIEEKLAMHILSISETQGSEKFQLNISATANALNTGRASIYRALNSLSLRSLITFENKIITIIDRNGLERI